MKNEAYKRRLIALGTDIKGAMEEVKVGEPLLSKLNYLLGFIDALDIEAVEKK